MVDISRALKIQGWMGEEELTWLAERASESQRIVEVGCWKGRTTVALATNTKGTVYAVDHWEGSEEHSEEMKNKNSGWLYWEWTNNVKHIKSVVPLQMKSLVAASVMRVKNLQLADLVDMIFLDASHDYQSVKDDIMTWLPLLNPGGLLCGHDYQPSWPGVMQAVDELVPNRQLLEPRRRCAIWWWRSERRVDSGKRADNCKDSGGPYLGGA